MEESNPSPSSRWVYICCSDLGEGNGTNRIARVTTSDPPLEVNNGLTDSGDIDNAPDRRREAEQWEFQPDDTPLPDELKATIEDA